MSDCHGSQTTQLGLPSPPSLPKVYAYCNVFLECGTIETTIAGGGGEYAEE